MIVIVFDKGLFPDNIRKHPPIEIIDGATGYDKTVHVQFQSYFRLFLHPHCFDSIHSRSPSISGSFYRYFKQETITSNSYKYAFLSIL